MILSELKDISVIDWGNTSLTKKSYQDLGKFLGVSAAGCDGRMDHAEHEVGTLVLSAIGAKCGKMFYPNESFTAIKNTITIKPNDSADSKYLFYYLNNNQIQSRGAGQPFITKGAASKTKIPLPPLDQQKKIAAILDAADAYRQKTKALIEKYDELKQSLFINMFGDPLTNPKGFGIRKLNEFIEVLVDVGSNGGNDWVSSNIKMKNEEDYALMIRTVNLNKQDFKNNLKYVSERTYNLFKKTKVYGGEIIMNKIGSAGKYWIMPNLNRPVSLGLNQLMMTFNNLDKTFFYYYYNTDYGRRLINSKLNGATTKSITKTALRDLDIFYPSDSLQNQFAERVQAIEAQKAQAQASLAQAEDLFNSLLQRAFKGELTS